jgi:hypothetical protein
MKLSSVSTCILLCIAGCNTTSSTNIQRPFISNTPIIRPPTTTSIGDGRFIIHSPQIIKPVIIKPNIVRE